MWEAIPRGDLRARSAAEPLPETAPPATVRAVQSSCNIAFKEWAVVVDALGRGDQVVILRKGGIAEDRGTFRVAHEQFWLFPTLFHQQMESVVPAATRNFDEVKSRYQPEGHVRIEFLARAEKVIECDDLAKLKALAGQHIWKESVVEDRFRWGKSNGLHVIVTRIYRLPEPVTLPMLPAYGGCKSWVELEKSLSTAGLVPVLSDSEFQTKAANLGAKLQ